MCVFYFHSILDQVYYVLILNSLLLSHIDEVKIRGGRKNQKLDMNC